MATIVRSLTHASRKLPIWVILILIAAALLGWAEAALGGFPVWATRPLEALSAFSTVFLGILIEAVPFLLLGTLASGIVDVFFGPGELSRWVPKNRYSGAVVGSLLGMAFPVCECGVVPLSRKMMQRGLPSSSGSAFVLGAPVLNPIVIASTLAAFGWGPVFWGRMGLTLLVAVVSGVVISLSRGGDNILRLDELHDPHPTLIYGPANKIPLAERWRQVLVVSADEFFEMGRYLVIGALIASFMQVIVPQGLLLAVNRGPVLPVLAMVLLAVLLSICSTVDAFIALAFVGVFPTGAILAFLVFGPMVDIKSMLMFQRAFQHRKVVLLVALPLLLTIVLAASWNLLSIG
jgi:uncharacterized protein